jgi:hypothetical protein
MAPNAENGGRRQNDQKKNNQMILKRQGPNRERSMNKSNPWPDSGPTETGSMLEQRLNV